MGAVPYAVALKVTFEPGNALVLAGNTVAAGGI